MIDKSADRFFREMDREFDAAFDLPPLLDFDDDDADLGDDADDGVQGKGSSDTVSEQKRGAKGVNTPKCLSCAGRTWVQDSFLLADGRFRRRRVCIECGQRFSTYELPVAQYKALLARSKRADKLAAQIKRLRR